MAKDIDTTGARSAKAVDHALVERVEARLQALGLSDRKASIDATGKPDAVRDIKGGVVVSARRLQKLAWVLQCSTDYLLGDDDPPAVAAPDAIPDDAVSALGRVARQLMELVMEQREEIKQLKAQNEDLAQYAIRNLPSSPTLAAGE